MATLLYRVSAKVDKITGLTEVLVRFFHGDLDQRAKTNIFIDSSHWDKKAQRNIIPRIRVMSPENKKVVETLSYQNTCLNSLEQFIHQEFINSGGGKAKHPDTWLADTIDKFYAPEPEKEDITPDEEQEPDFFSVFKHFIDTRRASESRKKHLMVDWRALKRFSIFRGEDITFDNLTSDTLRDFEQYLIKEHTYYKIEGENWRKKKVTFLDKRFAKAYKQVPESRLPAERGGNAISKIMVELRIFIICTILTSPATLGLKFKGTSSFFNASSDAGCPT